jgi:hypothetical protein
MAVGPARYTRNPCVRQSCTIPSLPSAPTLCFIRYKWFYIRPSKYTHNNTKEEMSRTFRRGPFFSLRRPPRNGARVSLAAFRNESLARLYTLVA